MGNTAKIRNLYERYVLPTYKKNPVALVRGKGSYVWDAEGKRYLDLFPGWGVDGLGHCPEPVVRAIRNQAGRLLHVPNNYYNDRQPELAEWISKKSFGGKCFFCNSGAEANEAAIKLARKWGSSRGRFEIVTANQSFHGRTLAAVTATGQEKYHDGFAPLVPGFRYVPFGDIRALREALHDKTVAVLLEPIQGEGGIRMATPEYFRQVRALCDERGILMMLDEVQTGMGRTGKFFAYQHFGIKPDVMTLAKALGGGVAIGAMVVDKKYDQVLVPGNHASTFGGNPLACAAAVAAFQTIQREKLLDRATRMGRLLMEGLQAMQKRYHLMREVRGLGLMIGVELDREGVPVVERAMEKGLLINSTAGNVIRFLPSLRVNKAEIAQGLKIFEEALDEPPTLTLPRKGGGKLVALH